MVDRRRVVHHRRWLLLLPVVGLLTGCGAYLAAYDDPDFEQETLPSGYADSFTTTVDTSLTISFQHLGWNDSAANGWEIYRRRPHLGEFWGVGLDVSNGLTTAGGKVTAFEDPDGSGTMSGRTSVGYPLTERIVYTPPPGFIGTDRFQYFLYKYDGDIRASAWASITVVAPATTTSTTSTTTVYQPPVPTTVSQTPVPAEARTLCEAFPADYTTGEGSFFGCEGEGNVEDLAPLVAALGAICDELGGQFSSLSGNDTLFVISCSRT
jgi:hypothetical protein